MWRLVSERLQYLPRCLRFDEAPRRWEQNAKRRSSHWWIVLLQMWTISAAFIIELYISCIYVRTVRMYILYSIYSSIWSGNIYTCTAVSKIFSSWPSSSCWSAFCSAEPADQLPNVWLYDIRLSILLPSLTKFKMCHIVHCHVSGLRFQLGTQEMLSWKRRGPWPKHAKTIHQFYIVTYCCCS